MPTKYDFAYYKIGINILYYRKLQGLTQEGLAELSNYSRNHIQQVETGKTAPSVALLIDVADALRIPVYKLFEFDR